MKDSKLSLELDKILGAAASYAVLEGGRELLTAFTPVSDISQARRLLDLTEEADLLLNTLGSGRVLYYPPQGDALERAQKGSTLSCTELLAAAALLRSARVLESSVRSFADERTVRMRELTEYLIFDKHLEDDISEKIIGENELADHASDKLYAIRREIRLLNERIRARLQEYLARRSICRKNSSRCGTTAMCCPSRRSISGRCAGSFTTARRAGRRCLSSPRKCSR